MGFVEFVKQLLRGPSPRDRALGRLREVESMSTRRSIIAMQLEQEFSDVPGMSGRRFEGFVGRILRAQGHEVREMGGPGDQGVDLLVELDGRGTVAVQCKNYARPVGNAPVQEVYAGARYHGADDSWVVAPGGYTKGASELADRLGVSLFRSADLLAWIKTLDVSVAREGSYLLPDEEVYPLLLQQYREHVGLVRRVHEARALGDGDPEVELRFRGTKTKVLASLLEVIEQLNLLEERNSAGLPIGERFELRIERQWIEREVASGKESVDESLASRGGSWADRKTYDSGLRMYRKNLGILHQINVSHRRYVKDMNDHKAQAEEAMARAARHAQAAGNPSESRRLERKAQDTRRSMERNVQETRRDVRETREMVSGGTREIIDKLLVLEGRNPDLPTWKRAHLRTVHDKIEQEAELG